MQAKIENNAQKKLNLGCGEFRKPGYINVDYYSISEPDIRHDLDRFPYPFRDNEFDLIEADHLLEHLNNPLRAMKELYRISKKNGLIIIRVPHFSRGFTHPDHKRGFDVSFPYYFNPAFFAGYQGFHLHLKKMKLSWFAQPYLKERVLSKPVYLMAYFTGKIIDFFANLSPNFCSRIWAFWVGGFEEIEFQFLIIK